jgi:hypothetical protein
MANHKYKNRKQQRAGCQMCKPQKTGGINPDREVGHRGFGKIRDLIHSQKDLEELNEMDAEVTVETVYNIYYEGEYYRANSLDYPQWQKECRKGGWLPTDTYEMDNILNGLFDKYKKDLGL